MSCINCGRKVMVLSDDSVSTTINGQGYCSECTTKELDRLQATVTALEKRISMSNEKRKAVSGINAAIPQYEGYTPNEFVNELLAEKDLEIAAHHAQLRRVLPYVNAHRQICSIAYDIHKHVNALLEEEVPE